MPRVCARLADWMMVIRWRAEMRSPSGPSPQRFAVSLVGDEHVVVADDNLIYWTGLRVTQAEQSDKGKRTTDHDVDIHFGHDGMAPDGRGTKT